MIRNQSEIDDPTSEEEYLKILYDAPQQYTWEEYQAAIEPAKNSKGLALLRMYRNGCLQLSDYIMTIDFSKKLSNLEEWISYRQALRDYTNTPITYIWSVPYDSLDFSAMNFPQKPSLQFI